MTRFLILAILALPLSAQSIEWRLAGRAGAITGAGQSLVGTFEVEARSHNWALAPAVDLFNVGYGTRATHLNLRHVWTSDRTNIWIGAGPTWVITDEAGGHARRWNVDAGISWLPKSRWEPFVAVRHYSFRIPVFRDVIEVKGPMIAAGVALRLH